MFLRARSNISEHLYGDVLQCLEWLQSIGVAVGVMTNGNANLADCSLAPYLSLVLTAGLVGSYTTRYRCYLSYLSMSLSHREVGAAKPSIIPFFACCQRSGFLAARIL